MYSQFQHRPTILITSFGMINTELKLRHN